MIFQISVIPSLSNRIFYHDAIIIYLVFMLLTRDYPTYLLSIWNIAQLGPEFLIFI